MALPLFSLLGCQDAAVSTEGDEASVAESQLTGGRQAVSGEYASTLTIGGCTGAKVGPRHILVAAHCVHDYVNNRLWSSFEPGGTVSVTNEIVPTNYRQLSIVKTTMAPGWTETCSTPCGVNVLNPSHPADAAVIEVVEETPDIPAASIDSLTVLEGDPVVMTGYGCENGYGNPSGPSRFKLESTTALTAAALVHPGPMVSEEDAPNVAASYVITPGMTRDPASASLCPGDSGGPLYRKSATELLVVGVNAYYSFLPASNGVSQTNWHTRLDGGARYPVLDWLSKLGVNIHWTAAPPAPTDVVAEAGDAKVVLQWKPATGAVSYVVKRTTYMGKFLPVGTTKTTSFTDTTVTNGTTYYYIIAGVNPVGEGVGSTMVSAKPTQPTVPTEPCSPALDVSWGQSLNTTGTACWRTKTSIAGWGCSNFDGRTLKVNGVAVTCGSSLPSKVNGYYYFDVSAGKFPWASIYWWQ
ncbi:MAG: trypsin-like serine protease [Polyangiaceae bacterium]